MAIDRTFEAALMKAIRSLESGVYGLKAKGLDLWSDMEIEECLREPTDQRLFAIFEAFRRGLMLEEIAQLSNVDPWFLRKLQGLVAAEREIRRAGPDNLTEEFMRHIKKLGFSDHTIGALVGMKESKVQHYRRALGVIPTYKMVDTCAAEFEAATPYYYSCYESENETSLSDKKRIIVLGSGPIRIGQGIEFDYCSVHSVWALREEGYESIIINNNPETVSTDFDTADKLFFEPLTEEDVMNLILDQEPEGVVVQFGGQTAVNLAPALYRNGIKIIGTAFEDIDRAEDRDKFDQVVEQLGIPRPAGKAVTSLEAAEETAMKIGFPVLVRPSYVLGGRAMEICYSNQDLRSYMHYAADVSPGHPVLVDKYIVGKEAEVDCISDGREVLIPGIMEHIERAGIHSGDSMAVYPPVSLSQKVCDTMIEYAVQLCRALNVSGLLNIQYVIDDNDKVFILEVNPRASRTVPYLSKVTGIPMVNVATKLMLGRNLQELGYTPGLFPARPYFAVKAPVFSFSKLTKVEVSLGPEMKSTGEIMGVDPEYPIALYKAMVASGMEVPRNGALLATIADRDKAEAHPIIKGFAGMGYLIYATKGTSEYLLAHGIENIMVNKIREGSPNVLELVREGKVNFLINTLSKHRPAEEREGVRIRRASVEQNLPCLTSLDTARALLHALSARTDNGSISARAISDYFK
jgi:carbamoyl-phosphate synthase large subunit